MPYGPKPKPSIERFLPKVEKPECGCWKWIGRVDSQTGYGKFLFDGRVSSAHRFAYQHFVGPIEPGKHINHMCRNRWCVNPDHLEAATPGENLERGDTSYRAYNKLKTHCPQGHMYDRQTTFRHADGRRFCRACNRERMRARRAARGGRRSQLLQKIEGIG